MNTTPRDGTMESNGLKADFRFIRHHPYDSNLSYVETATGTSWFHNELLTYDVVKEKPVKNHGISFE